MLRLLHSMHFVYRRCVVSLAIRDCAATAIAMDTALLTSSL